MSFVHIHEIILSLFLHEHTVFMQNPDPVLDIAIAIFIFLILAQANTFYL